MRIYQNVTRDGWPPLCSRPTIDQADLTQTVRAVYDNVDLNGDTALIELTERFDKTNLVSLDVGATEIANQASKVSPHLKRALDEAAKNIRVFHTAQCLNSKKITVKPGIECWQETRPISTVGIYVPGGSAPLVSSVLMLGIPAQIAGCKQIVLCTPPDKFGNIDPAICYAAQMIGASKVIRVGGAQAVVAMALGTATVPKVDKIFGPGNQYVTAAKSLAYSYGAAIDMPAGPSEVMVIADNQANPAWVAADLLSQAEHGTDSQVVLLTDTMKLASAVNSQLNKQLAELPRQDIARVSLKRSFCLVLSDMYEAMEFANLYAPEHVILNTQNAEKLAGSVINAGSVFLGAYSPEAAGDYASGTNHTLPTNGWARSYGGVSLDSFVKKITFQRLTKNGLFGLEPTITTLAEAEGLKAHKRAVTIRFDKI